MNGQLFFTVGLILILAGFLTVFAASLLLLFKTLREKGKAKGGAVVVIGPFPIVFGTDKKSVKMLLLMSVALIALMLILTISSYYSFW